ncbi:conserved hypothetical protein [Gloeothece citriformis PCC 7424]|uniref:Uncharacterized protein n=1 Tax=Gloeothece citriformis (strain PCC 7424) TaxID=65393 RepID=B7KL86_GLOC7|nr:hypothetical protein [Gloeothece citriformis]ACK72458.1 conserved hypothetical protein [Gloeothece citriformis PCC 7424]
MKVSGLSFEEFIQLLRTESSCPKSLSVALQGLWYDKKGNWDRGHEIVQDANDSDSAWVHAYLHRKEGDISNAHYWYRRSGKPAANTSLDQEWEDIVRALLN